MITEIVLSLARPGLAATLILTWVFAWNEILLAWIALGLLWMRFVEQAVPLLVANLVALILAIFII